MARYFFHTEDGRAQRDDEGTELPDHAAAKAAGVGLLGDLLRSRGADLWEDRIFRVVITDDTGLILFALDVSAVEAPATTPVG